ncbi:MAG: ABC transporter transmembrane domain-containing protein [Acidiferrobacterales bacterium]
MEPSIFKFVLRYSKREQIILLCVTLVSLPFLYISLDLPKTIINKAIGGTTFPREVFGYELEQIPFLMLLCGLFLVLVFINGGFKYFVNVYRGVVSERMLRRLRHQLFERVLRFPLPHFRKQSQGEIVSMVTAETEPLGGYVGESIALPAFQGGTLLTILVFMFVQDPILGTAAIALYPAQAYLIPKLQRKVNALGKQRVVQVRSLSERIGEVVTGVQEVHAHDTSRFELADFSQRMGEIYVVRLKIYRLKFFIKFTNNFIDKLTPFFFYSIGGYLVIRGSLTFGALVAVLAAYKDISAPWKELLKYYQTKEDARIKYDLLRETFDPAGMLDERMQVEEPEDVPPLVGELIAANVDLREEDESDTAFASGTTFKFKLPQSVAILGRTGSGQDRLAMIMSGITRARSGTITIGDLSLIKAPETVTGRRIAYVGQEPRLRLGSVRDNLLYPLKHRPLRAASYDEETGSRRESELAEAALSGNSNHDINADWIDYEAAGVTGPDALIDRTIEVLTIADIDQDIYQLGLRGSIDPEEQPELASRILEARRALRDRLRDPQIAPLVEQFDWDKYNENMTVAENLLFGSPRDPSFAVENLPQNAYVRKVLEDTGLTSELVTIGRKVAELMVDLFSDVEPGSELFEQYSFIGADDLPAFQSICARTENLAPTELASEDHDMLCALPFKLIPARHRLGVGDARLRVRLLEARHALAEMLGPDTHAVEFFDPDKYNPAISIQDNILFGRLAYGRARGASEVGALIDDVVEKLGLRDGVIEQGLDHSVGIAGARLTAAQRQKLAIARAVLKRPDLLIIDRATAVLDGATQTKIIKGLFKEFEGRGLIWVLHRASLGSEFDHTLVLDNGKVVEQGRFADLDKPGSVVNELVVAS